MPWGAKFSPSYADMRNLRFSICDFRALEGLGRLGGCLYRGGGFGRGSVAINGPLMGILWGVAWA